MPVFTHAFTQGPFGLVPPNGCLENSFYSCQRVSNETRCFTVITHSSDSLCQGFWSPQTHTEFHALGKSSSPLLIMATFYTQSPRWITSCSDVGGMASISLFCLKPENSIRRQRIGVKTPRIDCPAMEHWYILTTLQFTSQLANRK